MLHPNLRSCFETSAGSTTIFGALAALPVPWANVVQASLLDTVYMYNQSGSKPPSPLVSYLVDKREEYLTDEDVEYLANICYNLNNEAWSKLWEAEGLAYNPIENYSMVEEMDDTSSHEKGTSETETRALTSSSTGSDTTTHGETIGRTDNLTHTRTGTDTTTHGQTEARTGTEGTAGTVTPNTIDTSTHSVAGFNSSGASVADTDQVTHTGTTSENSTITYNTLLTHGGSDSLQISHSDTDGGTQTITHGGQDSTSHQSSGTQGGTVTREHDGTDTDTRSYTLTRSGNIGVTTSQQMLTAEREVRAWRFFRDRVFPDIDNVLTLCVY